MEEISRHLPERQKRGREKQEDSETERYRVEETERKKEI